VPERNVGEMNGHDGIGVTARELFYNGTAPVSPVRTKSLIACLSSSEPEVANLKERPSFGRFIRKTISGQIGNNDIERLFRPSLE
jgi:hypothetical protein